jgi:hypothetical protein
MTNFGTRRGAIAAALAAAAVSLAGCYVLPVAPESYPYAFPYPAPAAAPAQSHAPISGAPAVRGPITLQARLYPANEVAKQTGVIHGTVTNMLTGKGRFLLKLSRRDAEREATRIEGDSRRGVASAFGSSGGYMSCEYQMRTPQQGAGTCQFSNGAKYQVHIGT